MHDINAIRDEPDAFDAGLRRRGLAPQAARLLALDDRRRAAIARAQAAQERRNALSREIGAAKKARDEARAAALMAEVAALKEGIPAAEAEEREAQLELDHALAEIPNTPDPDVPEGADEHGNVEREDHRFEGSRGRNVGGRQHFELGEATGLMDFEAAAKLSGSRFVVLRGQLARLERALGQFMLDLHTGEHGYTEVAPPLLVRDEAMFGTAQLPKFQDDQFFALSSIVPEEDARKLAKLTSKLEQVSVTGESLVESENKIRDSLIDIVRQSKLKEEGLYIFFLETIVRESQRLRQKYVKVEQENNAYLRAFASRLWLIPTAEVPLTNIVRAQITPEEELPLRFTALTPCFRAEAGAAGRDTRGMLRQHQFTKCELVSVTTPETSREEHERMLGCAEAVLKRLDLPYRVMTLCTGDMGFASARTYDIEVWLPGQGTYREISSCSTCNDFQARRMGARYRPKGAKGTRLVHTLNGSGVAVGRALIAVMENYQDEGGAIAVPDALRPYMGGLARIEGTA